MKAPTIEQLKGNGEALPTIQVMYKEHPDAGPITINAHDFDETVHTKYAPKKSAEAESADGDGGGDDPRDSMSSSELKAYLTEHGVDFPGSANKAKLLELAKAVQE